MILGNPRLLQSPLFLGTTRSPLAVVVVVHGDLVQSLADLLNKALLELLCRRLGCLRRVGSGINPTAAATAAA